MPELNIPILNSLEDIISKSIEMEKVTRWKKYSAKGEARQENTLQHSYTASLLAIIVIENEINYCLENDIFKGFDDYIVLKATVLHDLGEIEKGDTVYIDKTVQEAIREMEFFKKFISPLPEYIRNQMYLSYCLQNIGKQGFEEPTAKLKEMYPTEVRLFEAIERLGYLIFAYREFRREKREKIFIQVLRHNHHHLVRLANELPGFGKTFYTPEIQKSIEDFLKQYEGQFIEQKGES